MMMVGTATLPELVLVIVPLIGLIANLWALSDAVADLRWQEAAPMPMGPDRRTGVYEAMLRDRLVRERIARGNARRELTRCLIQTAFIVVGIVAVASAPVNPGRPIPALAIVYTAGLVAAQIALMTMAIQDRRDRIWIIGTLTRRVWRDGGSS